jgi:ABC-2 type transport system permease protein
VEKAMVFNPLTMIFTQMRHALIDPSAPTAADVAGGTGLLAIPLVMIVVVSALGVWAFVRETPRMAEML